MKIDKIKKSIQTLGGDEWNRLKAEVDAERLGQVTKRIQGILDDNGLMLDVNHEVKIRRR